MCFMLFKIYIVVKSHHSTVNSLRPSDTIYALVNCVNIGSGNGLSPIWGLAITWTNADLLSIGTVGTNLSEIWIKIRRFSI